MTTLRFVISALVFGTVSLIASVSALVAAILYWLTTSRAKLQRHNKNDIIMTNKEISANSGH